MADEYISREAAYNAIVNNYTIDDQLKDLCSVPAADVAEVRHGKWVWNGETCCNEFSVCGVGEMWFRILMEYYYCPNCGAKMDERSEDDI